MSELLRVDGLNVHYPVGGGFFGGPQGYVHAVDGVSFSVDRGEVVALVGETGCGKTTIARAIAGLVRPTSGTIHFAGRDVGSLKRLDRAYRRQVQMIFQDPFDSLNPRRTVFQTIAQPLRIHDIVPRRELRSEATRLLDTVGLAPGGTYLDRFPHQFSGGQRQRICIARSLAVRPSLVVADEAVSALDISIRAQVLTLMRELQVRLGLSYLFITHDLGVVRSLADRVLVMYLGQIVEEGPTERIFAQPHHPYTVALLSASPVTDPVHARKRARRLVSGDVPSPVDPPAGCRFHTRCPMAQPICETDPSWVTFGEGQRSYCHFAPEVEAVLGSGLDQRYAPGTLGAGAPAVTTS